MKQVVEVGDKIFETKKAALAYFKDILNSYKFNEKLNALDFNDVFNLLLNHPNAKDKIGSGVKEIRVSELRFKTKCFEIVRLDESTELFSYTKRINKPLSSMARFRNACRQSIQNDLRNVKLAYFKKHSKKGRVKCQESNDLLKWEELNVDHRQPNTFSVIVERFLEANNINLEKVEYEEVDGGQDELADFNLREQFILYHKEKANLRLIKQSLNRGRAHQGRGKRQKKDLVIE